MDNGKLRVGRRRLPVEQARLARAMLAYDSDPFAAPCDVRACIDSMSEDALRLFNYDYYFMNLLSVFGATCSVDSVRKLALACNRVRLWSRWQRYSEGVQSQYHHPKLACWQPDILRSLLRLGRGILLLTGHFGAYWYLRRDVHLLGFEKPWLCTDTDSAHGLRCRMSAGRGSEQEANLIQEGNPSVFDRSMRVVDVEQPLAGVQITKLFQNNQIVIAFADGNTGSDGRWGNRNKMEFDFLNHRVATKCGIVNIAAATGTPILPVLAKSTYRSCHPPTTFVGAVGCRSPIVPPLRPDATARESFVQSTLPRIFGYLEEAVRTDPEQWDGACFFHRLRRPLSHANEANDVTPHLDTGSQQGLRLRLNEKRSVLVPLEEGSAIVDVHTLKVFKVPTSLCDFVTALAAPDGIKGDRCGHARAYFLASLKHAGLLHVIRKEDEHGEQENREPDSE